MPTEEILKSIHSHIEAAQNQLWNLKHTEPLSKTDNETVRHMISGIDAMHRQLDSYGQWLESLGTRG